MPPNHNLRITNAVTGANPMVFIDDIGDGYDWRDFDGSLDAPDHIARGSSVRCEYALYGMPMVCAGSTMFVIGRL